MPPGALEVSFVGRLMSRIQEPSPLLSSAESFFAYMKHVQRALRRIDQVPYHVIRAKKR